MNDQELLETIQNSAILVNLDFRTSGERDKSIENKLRRELAGIQTEIFRAFEDRSIEFGGRRLILASEFHEIVTVAGTAKQRLKEACAAVSEDQALGFHVGFTYEPVPRGNGFNMLPPEFSGHLASSCDRRQVQNFYNGMETLLDRALQSATHYFEKLSEYEAWVNSPTTRAVVMRAINVTRFQHHLRLLDVYNLMRSERYAAIAGLSGVVMTTDVDDLRKDTVKRRAALASARMIKGRLTLMLFGDEAVEDTPIGEEETQEAE